MGKKLTNKSISIVIGGTRNSYIRAEARWHYAPTSLKKKKGFGSSRIPFVFFILITNYLV